MATLDCQYSIIKNRQGIPGTSVIMNTIWGQKYQIALLKQKIVLSYFPWTKNTLILCGNFSTLSETSDIRISESVFIVPDPYLKLPLVVLLLRVDKILENRTIDCCRLQGG